MILETIWFRTVTAHNLRELGLKPIVIIKYLLAIEHALLLRYSLRRKGKLA